MARLWNTWAKLPGLELVRRVCVLPAVFSLAACGAFAGGDYDLLFKAIKQSWNGNSTDITLEQAGAVPFATMGVRLGSSEQAMIVLAGDTHGQQLWASGANIALTTWNGRILHAVWVKRDLGSWTVDTSAQTPSEAFPARQLRWQADFPDLNLYAVQIVCDDQLQGPETIVILGASIPVRRVNEDCASESSRLDWTFHNTFWIDSRTNFVWKSVQYVHPKVDPIETEILRPPA
jgi:hypothetical protein